MLNGLSMLINNSIIVKTIVNVFAAQSVMKKRRLGPTHNGYFILMFVRIYLMDNL